MKKYLDPKADLTFKKIFGEHEDLLISLLNALLPLKEDELVEEVEYLSPELVPDNYVGKNSIVDVRCKDIMGRQFLVEMQMLWTPAFQQRVLFNASKAFVRQLDKRRRYELLQPVYSLNLVNEVFMKDYPDEFIHNYNIVHDLHDDKLIKGLHFTFIELPKFKPQTIMEKKMAVLWLKFLTQIDEDTTVVPQDLLDNPETSKALETVEEAAMTKSELLAYDDFWDKVGAELQQDQSREGLCQRSCRGTRGRTSRRTSRRTSGGASGGPRGSAGGDGPSDAFEGHVAGSDSLPHRPFPGGRQSSHRTERREVEQPKQRKEMKILAVGMNYLEHNLALHGAAVKPERPVLFMKSDSAVLKNGKPFFIPDDMGRIEYETEVVVRICRLGKCIPLEFAHRYYDAYTVGIDLTARDLQKELKAKGQPWELAKGFDGSAVLGEWVEKEKFLGPQRLHFHLDINGKTVQTGCTADMLYTIDELISYASRYFTLKTGDLFYTGCPTGCGPVAIDDHLEGWLEDRKVLDFQCK